MIKKVKERLPTPSNTGSSDTLCTCEGPDTDLALKVEILETKVNSSICIVLFTLVGKSPSYHWDQGSKDTLRTATIRAGHLDQGK